MSLHNLARHVQSQGRGNDKMLVHMTPGEVQGLQSLAMKHGGSLTINPETGLPEAGFLESVLPTVVGAGLAATGIGMPFAIAAGAGTGLLTSGGNLQAGILGGLGAWGGASLVGGLMSAGAAAGAGAAESAGLLGNAAIAAGDTTAGMVGAANTGLPIGTETLGGTVTSGGLGGGSSVGAATPSGWDQLSKGYEATKFNTDYLKQNMFPIGAAVAPALFASNEQQYGPINVDQGEIRPYTYSQTRNPEFGKVPGAPYFTQTYTAGQPYAAKNGGIVALADGGQSPDVAGIDALQKREPNPATVMPTKGQQNVYGQVTPTDTGVDMIGLAPNLGQYTTQPRRNDPSVAAYNQILADRATNEYVTQAPLLTMLPGGGERANLADTKKLINEYYLSELGRQADPEGLDFWAQSKMNTGQTLADIKQHIYNSPEAVAKREAEAAQQAQQAQAALEASPAYQEYMAAPITEANFDAAAYLAANPDVANRSLWAGTPWQHYSQYGAGEGRQGFKKAFQAPAAPVSGPTPAVGGYVYDQATGQFTKVTPAAPAGLEGLFGDAFSQYANDPGFANYLQNEYNQYQQSQYGYGGGGKSGGLMPKALKYASGGISHLGDYSDGGRLLKGPGDGVSDSIPAQIGDRQPARLADGEFVVPARIVSELGNGSTDAGARKLYAMMDRIQKRRKKSVGKGKVAVDSKAETALPA